MTNNIRNPQLGYWQVGDRKFIDKTTALLESTQTKHHIQWIFNDQEFSKHNWKVEPQDTLETLYAQRARQLRETYDYLILSFSGGSDSVNILRTFLKNHIHLDEIVIQWPHKAAANLYTPNTQDIGQDNWLSEWDFTVRPQLQWLATFHPEIRITVYDYTDDMTNYVKSSMNDTWYLERNTYSPFGHIRHDAIRNIGLKRLENNQKVGYIYGVEKPKMMYKDNRYYVYFIDLLSGRVALPQYLNIDDCVMEFFYWSPRCVPLMIKQAHVIKRFMEANTACRSLITGHVKDGDAITKYQDLIEPLIYPGHVETFQVSKFRKGHLAVDKIIIENIFEDTVLDTYLSGIQELLAEVDQKYYDPETTIVTGLVSPFYEI